MNSLTQWSAGWVDQPYDQVRAEYIWDDPVLGNAGLINAVNLNLAEWFNLHFPRKSEEWLAEQAQQWTDYFWEVRWSQEAEATNWDGPEIFRRTLDDVVAEMSDMEGYVANPMPVTVDSKKSPVPLIAAAVIGLYLLKK